MVPSMSRPANPYDNASCESFMKTLKREEIYANKYDDLENLRANIQEFIEQYYNRQRLHSALGYRSPEEFEQQIEASGSTESRSATMVFFENKQNDERGSTRLLGKEAPGLREFRLAESQQILPPAGNRKPASDRTHWIQPVPCSSRRRSCPGGERGDRQSSVPADPTPSRASPTGRRIGGYDYKTKAIQQPHVEQHAHAREKRNEYFFCPLLSGWEGCG